MTTCARNITTENYYRKMHVKHSLTRFRERPFGISVIQLYASVISKHCSDTLHDKTGRLLELVSVNVSDVYLVLVLVLELY